MRWILAMLAVGAWWACSGADPQRTCGKNADCFEDVGYVCDLSDSRTCLQGCDDDEDCLGSQACDLNASPRVCRTSEANATD